MFWTEFLLRITIALTLGAVIGAERQLRQRLAGLRTNALVAMGACLFVLFSQLIPGLKSEAARLAAQVISGIGFLGAGVIMRDGLNVRGLNTAATLWCAAAVGVLAGAGLLVEAALGAVVILCANILLREIAQQINGQPLHQVDAELTYRLRVVCSEQDEVHVRALVMNMLSAMPIVLQGLQSRDMPQPGRLEVCADLLAAPASQTRLEEIVARISLEKSVSAVSWMMLPETDVVPPIFTSAPTQTGTTAL
jgi:putative Mg2+ transporter-C (MgtC) family protein